MLVVPHLINTRFRGLVPGLKNLIIHSRSTSLEESICEPGAGKSLDYRY
jgi:hypothetical protein